MDILTIILAATGGSLAYLYNIKKRERKTAILYGLLAVVLTLLIGYLSDL